jgi:hypothetical protein
MAYMSPHPLILSALLAQSRDSVSGKQNGDCAAWPGVDSKETPMKKGSTTIQWQILFHWRRNVGVWVSKIDYKRRLHTQCNIQLSQRVLKLVNSVAQFRN